MRKQKKDRTPAKGSGQIIGNRRTGKINLLKKGAEYNHQRQTLAELQRTLISGESTYLKVCRALESKFKGGG